MNGLYYGYGGTVDMFLLLIGFLITLIAQIKVKSAYSKYSKEDTRGDLSGCEVARKILDSADLKDIHVVEVPGELTDHYDPRNKVVRLSTKVFHDSSVASVAVAAHECGHAIQHANAYAPLQFRSAMFPVVNFANKFGYLAILLGFIFGGSSFLLLGIILVGVTVLFQIVTLPVEFNASTRAVAQLSEMNILYGNEEKAGARKVLTAAALTYVAGAVVAIAELLRLIMIFNSRNND